MVVIYVFKIDYVNMYLGERSYYECKRRGKVNSSIKRKYELEVEKIQNRRGEYLKLLSSNYILHSIGKSEIK